MFIATGNTSTNVSPLGIRTSEGERIIAIIYGSFAFSLIILNNITSRTKSTETDIRRINERNGWQMAFMS